MKIVNYAGLAENLDHSAQGWNVFRMNLCSQTLKDLQ